MGPGVGRKVPPGPHNTGKGFGAMGISMAPSHGKAGAKPTGIGSGEGSTSPDPMQTASVAMGVRPMVTQVISRNSTASAERVDEHGDLPSIMDEHHAPVGRIGSSGTERDDFSSDLHEEAQKVQVSKQQEQLGQQERKLQK